MKMADTSRPNANRQSIRVMFTQPLFHLQVLLVLSLFLGGGGVGHGIRNLLIQLFALILLGVNFGRVRQFFRQSSWLLIGLLGITLALPLIQLVPLPPELWQSLPGREPMVQAFAMAGIPQDAWAPLSVDRARTLVAFCGLIAPATVIIIASTFDAAHLKKLGWTIVVLGLAAFQWGVMQITTGNTIAQLHAFTPKPDVLYGFFANRNSMGLYFVLTLIALIALPVWRFKGAGLVKGIVFAFLFLGVILTQSRSSMGLLVVPLVFGAAKLLWVALNSRPQNSRRKNPRGNFTKIIALPTLGALLLVGALGVSFSTGGRVTESFGRFANIETDRLGMWDDAQYAARHYWPAGSGMGTFDEVFQLHESLEYVSTRRAGRAHNDYLELGMEAGLGGLIILVGWLIWLATSTWNWRSRPDPWLALSGSAGLLCIILQSALDYPLRNQTMLCLAALSIAYLAGKVRPKNKGKQR